MNRVYFGVVKRIFMSILLIKVTICHEPTSSEGDVQFYPEALLNSDIPNLIEGGPYYLCSYQNSHGETQYHIMSEDFFDTLLEQDKASEYSIWKRN